MIKLLNLDFKRNKDLSTSYHKVFTCVKYPDFHICFSFSSLTFLQTQDYYRTTIINCNLYQRVDLESRSDVKFQTIIKKNIVNITAQLISHFEKIKMQNLIFNEFSDSFETYKILK
jgi:hypothetical protein